MNSKLAHLQHLSKSSLFLSKRLVFKEGEGEKPIPTAASIEESARTEAINAALSSETPGDMKKAAETRIKATEADDKIKQEALTKLEANNAKFEEVKAYIALKTKAKTLLSQFKENQDWNFDNVDRLEAVKKDLDAAKVNDPNKGTLTGDIDTKVSSIESSAESYYGTAAKNGKAKAESLKADFKDLAAAFDLVGQLQGNKLRKFKGIKDTEKIGAETNEAVTNLLAKINELKGQLAEEDQKKFTDTYGAALTLTNTANPNFDSSRNSTQEGWKAGAEQYMAMSVAYNKALSAYESLPKDVDPKKNWYVKDAGGLSGWSDKYKDIVAVYTKAFKDFEEGKTHLKNSKDDDSLLGAKLFNAARDGFLQVKAAATEEIAENNNKEKADIAKTSSEKAKETSQKYWDKNILTVNNEAFTNYAKSKGDAKWYEAVDVLDKKAKEAYDKGDFEEAKKQYDAAKAAFDASLDGYTKAKTDYNNLISNGNQSLARAITHVQGEAVKEKNLKNITQVITDYLGDSRVYSGIDAGLEKVYQSLVFKGSFNITTSSGVYPTYYVDAKFGSSGKIEVSVTTTTKLSDDQLIPLEVREPMNQEKLNQEIKQRLASIKSWYNEKGMKSPSEFEKVSKDFLADTLRRLSPEERALLKDQVFQISYTEIDGGKLIDHIASIKIDPKTNPRYKNSYTAPRIEVDDAVGKLSA